MRRTIHNAIRNTQLILALDVDNQKKVDYFVNLLYPEIKIFKVGLQLFSLCGPEIIQKIKKKGAEVFLDLKFHDIPNTMKNAVKQILKYNPLMFTVHIFSGPEALKEVVQISQASRTKVLGVTILTSISEDFLKILGIKRSLLKETLYLAKIAKNCGLDGVVCSIKEAGQLRKELGKDFILVSPGIRPAGVLLDDQKRTASLEEIKMADVDYIVVGRPILQAKDPLKVTKDILSKIYAAKRSN